MSKSYKRMIKGLKNLAKAELPSVLFLAASLRRPSIIKHRGERRSKDRRQTREWENA